MIRWNFKSYIFEKHQIYSVTELQKLIVKKTGVVISLAQLCKFVNQKPSMLRLLENCMKRDPPSCKSGIHSIAQSGASGLHEWDPPNCKIGSHPIA